MDTLTSDLHKKAWISLKILFAKIYGVIKAWEEAEELIYNPDGLISYEHYENDEDSDLSFYIEEIENDFLTKDVENLSKDFYYLASDCERLNIDIWHYYEDVELCLDLLSVDESELIYTPNQNLVVIPKLILEVHDDLIRQIAKKPEAIFHIAPRKFEEIIAEIFFKKGFKVELTKATRDGGRDIVAINENLDIKTKFIIECKRYAKTNKVSIGIVQRLLGVKISEQANKAILATTSTFTRDARVFASNHMWDLDLKDYEDILGWIKSY
jgi:Restriction endonuclease